MNMEKLEFIVESPEAGVRIDRVLAEKGADCSRS